MKLYTFLEAGRERVGVGVADDMIADLALASAAPWFADMMALIAAGDPALEEARTIAATPPPASLRPFKAVTLVAPLPRPRKLRGASVFEAHLRGSAEGAARRLAWGASDPEAMYLHYRKAMNLDAIPGPGWSATPAYYYMDVEAVAGHDSTVTWPNYSNWIDYELELVAVIGRTGKDIARADAQDHIFGYTILNDLSARDEQLKGMATSLGPAKGKDFDGSNVMGPCIVTADEIADPYALTVAVRVNGEEWSRTDGREAHFRFDECIAYASQAQTIRPGEMFSTGTFPGCCSLELQREVKRGATIEFEVAQIGLLRTHIA